LAQRNTQILAVEFASATFAVRGISNTQIIFKMCLRVEDFLTEFAQGYCERASDEFWPPAPDQIGKCKDGRIVRCDQQNIKQQSDKVAHRIK